jgi:hypothetical protein
MTNETIVVIIKLLHTVIFLFVSGCILYVLVCAISGRTSPKLMNAAAIVPTVIGILWLLNGHECLLASVVYRLSGGDRSIADIFPIGFRAGS